MLPNDITKISEYKDKLRKSKLGKKRSRESIEKQRKRLIGRKLTRDHIDNIRTALVGRTIYWKDKIAKSLSGKVLSRKHKDNISRGRKGLTLDKIHKRDCLCCVCRSKLGEEVRNRSGISGHFYSNKNKCMLFYRSSYEFLAFQMLESLIYVKLYKVNFVIIPYIFENKKHDYVIDLYVEYFDGQKQLIEVKSCWSLNRKQTQVKLEAGKQFAECNGMKWDVWTEKELQITKEKYYTICNYLKKDMVVKYTWW